MRHQKDGGAGGTLHLRSAKAARKKTTVAAADFNRFALSAKWGWLLIPLLLLLLLPACGGGAVVEPDAAPREEGSAAAADADEVGTEAMAEAAADPAEAAGTPMRTLTDALGQEIEVPVDPERIVVLSELDLDSALALGVTPVGATNGRGQETLPSYLLDRAAGIASIGSIAEPNPEAIAALQPDLIIVGSPIPPVEALLPALAEIAPTAVTFPAGASWQEALLGVAGVLNRTAEAEAFLASYEERVAAAAARLPEGLAEVSVVRWQADGPRVMLPNSFSSLVLADAGLGRPAAHAEMAGAHPVHSDVISMERIDVVDGDVIFAGGLNPEGAAALDQALADPLVQTLTAVQAGHVIVVDGLVWGSVGGPLAAMQVLDDLDKAIAGFTSTAAAAGDDPITSGPIDPLPRTVTDFEGNELVIEDDSAIVAMDGPLTEIVFALGMGDRVIAADASSTYPPEVRELPQVGYVRRLSAEPVLALAPALILTTDGAGPPEALAQLRESGVTVVQFTAPTTVAESLQLVRDVAAALGVPSRGEALVAKIEADLAAAAELRAQATTSPRVMLIYARGADSVSAAGSGTSIDVMFELAGVENAITEWEGYQPLTAEGAVSIAPDALLLFESGLQSVGGVEGLLGIPGLAETPAGQDQNVHSMDGLLMTGLGPRLGEAVIELMRMLHPELQ